MNLCFVTYLALHTSTTRSCNSYPSSVGERSINVVDIYVQYIPVMRGRHILNEGLNEELI